MIEVPQYLEVPNSRTPARWNRVILLVGTGSHYAGLLFETGSYYFNALEQGRITLGRAMASSLRLKRVGTGSYCVNDP